MVERYPIISPREWLAIAEASAALLAADLALRFLSFGRVVRTISTASNTERQDANSRIGEVALAVSRATRLPVPKGCLRKSIAAGWMLRRRRVAVLLYYGVASTNHEFHAHAWLEAAGLPVVGDGQEETFTLLATFPGDT